MKKIALIFVLAVCMCAVVIGLFYPRDSSAISTEVIAIPGGYGYVLKNGNKVLIKQQIIPAISNTSPFCTYDDARAVAFLVRKKMLKGETPAITKEELKALHVRLNCIDLAN